MMSSQRGKMAILFVAIAVVMIAFSMVMPILPSMIDDMGGSGRDIGLSAAVFAVMQLLMSTFWGNLSDTYGRKPIILVGLVGCSLALVMYGLATELWMLYGARAFAGTVSSATFPTAMAYVGDITSDEERGGGMGMVSAAMYAGIMVGPTASGWLAGISLTLPFFAGAVLAGLFVGVVLLWLPESLPTAGRAQRVPLLQGIRPPDFREMWSAMRGPIGYQYLLSFLLMFGLMTFWSIFGMYALERYGFGPGPVGTIMAVVGAASSALQLFLVGPMAKRWGEELLVKISLSASVVGFVAMLLAQDMIGLMVTATLYVMANSLARPLVTALISRAATEGQGEAMGLNNAFASLGQIVGPTWAGLALDLHLSLPFASGALVMLLSWFSTFRGFKPRLVSETS